TLSGASGTAGGTVTYTVYSDNACTTSFASAGTRTVTNGTVPDSDPVTFTNAGTFYWQAAYSGDANDNPAVSACTSETLVVQPNPTSMVTAQNLLPNDSAALSLGSRFCAVTMLVGLGWTTSVSDVQALTAGLSLASPE